ncbi:ABC transporter substrate-binding protein [Arthrobacter sp. MYb213]|uniref:siderophore ABC transporter substrate-binding protein n=1 Tax=Arthrobacter sp. MYb213 TaxID=1848595 RepID=UPI000CFDB9DB|nr:ABC transporter substrate-binding protein [Arthrobacter sp. MYb213]PRB70271.1 iron ABC transporter substrate-binding protein [Arthrobacter sp. MYb213]
MAPMKLRAAALLGVAALTLTACGSNTAAPAESAPASSSSVTFTDNNGEHTINTPAKSVVATDNRTFETLEAWDIKLSAGAVALMPDTISYAKDDKVVDLGSHREPNLEAIVEVAPDLIINGQRFTQHADKISKLAPEATIVNLDPREGEPFDKELKRQTTVLGEIFGKQAEAKALTDDFDKSVARAKAAYNKDDKVMGLITSGGEINYSAPGSGRSVGPAFDILGLTPALVVEDASTDHEGDDISVEAIAGSNPDWMLVLDRDGAVAADESGYTPAADLLKKSEALANVTASKEGNIVVMPADTYTNEGIQTYTEFFNDFADALESK